MKKLFIIIAIILTPNAGSAQLSGVLGYIHERPEYEFWHSQFFAPLLNPQLSSPQLKSLLKAIFDYPDSTFEYGKLTYTIDAKEKVSYKSLMRYLNMYTYSFVYKKKLYMLSYDSCITYNDTCTAYYGTLSSGHPIIRGLYLFRLDDNAWVKASDKPVQIDYETLKSTWIPNKPEHDIRSSYTYFPWRVAGDRPADKGQFGYGVNDGRVDISASGIVTIVLVNHRYYSDNGSRYIDKTSFENRTVVLIPNNDGTYNVQ